MQKYKCHKTVHATKVNRVSDRENYLVCDDGVTYEMPSTYKPKSDDLGYLVEYEDGYRSWSPSKPFEDGYSPVSE